MRMYAFAQYIFFLQKKKCTIVQISGQFLSFGKHMLGSRLLEQEHCWSNHMIFRNCVGTTETFSKMDDHSIYRFVPFICLLKLFSTCIFRDMNSEEEFKVKSTRCSIIKFTFEQLQSLIMHSKLQRLYLFSPDNQLLLIKENIQ